jgi:HlyD family secretion protein
VSRFNNQNWLGAAAVAAILALAAYFGFVRGDPSGSGDWQVETSPVDRGDIERTVATSGAVRPLITVEVGSQLSGQVAEIMADFNSPVKKGQVIARIDPQTFESRVLQSRADLRVAEANVTVQQASIDRAQANLRQARLAYERTAPLAKKGTVSDSDLDAATAAFESAKADLTMAQAQLQNAQASMEQRKASLESAEIDLERTRIRSPIDGVVIERAVDQGQTVAASLSSPTLFYIAQDLTEIQIEANVDEADIGSVREGQDARFTVDAYPDEQFRGRVNQVRLAPTELNNVVTYTVIITAGNPDKKLLPGMTAIVDIVTGKSENVMRVSNDAVRFAPPPGAVPESEAESGEAATTRRNPMADIQKLSEDLGLEPLQARQIRAELQTLFDGMRQSFQAGGAPGGPSSGDREALRERMKSQVEQVFQSNLTAEQYERYQAIRREMQETRQGRIWVQQDDGELRSVDVRLGLSDEHFTQIIEGDVEIGAPAVTRMHAVKG